jgi:nitroimidazol reductase NimA-like FMN-containing flavoprotein (pyridoxamine 5'-phosphate oxidase superfamily)
MHLREWGFQKTRFKEAGLVKVRFMIILVVGKNFLDKGGQVLRRADKEITDEKMLVDIICRSSVCRLGLSDDGVPYVVPMNFGYEDRTVYFHCAPEGRKLEIIRKSPKVCVEFDLDHQIIVSENACGWGMRFRSVIAFGMASIVDDGSEKMAALKIIMKQYSDRDWQIDADGLEGVCIIKVELDRMTGKKSGYG